MKWLLVVGLAVGLIGLGAWRLDTVSGQDALTSVVAPGSWPVDGGNFTVEIRIENVNNLGSYEWQLAFDPGILKFESARDGGFLGGTGRLVSCQPAIVGPAYREGPEGPVLILEEGNVRFGCVTLGLQPPGRSGSDVLSIVTLSPLAEGVSNLDLAWVSLSDPLGEDLPSARLSGCIAIGAVATCAAPTVAPPATATPETTATPGGEPSDTPIAPGPTNTPVPTGPTATPTPLPPGLEAVPLVAGCNAVTSTYPDATPIQTLSGAVGPAGNLVSLWKFDVGTWRAFSPQYPQASDLTEANLLDVVFACVGGPGDFVRPVI